MEFYRFYRCPSAHELKIRLLMGPAMICSFTLFLPSLRPTDRRADRASSDGADLSMPSGISTFFQQLLHQIKAIASDGATSERARQVKECFQLVKCLSEGAEVFGRDFPGS